MPHRILVVEDHDDTRLMMSVMLGARGYGVETAGGYGDALRLAGAGSYDLILLDYRYADGTGAELCRRIRESDRETPILFFSGVDPGEGVSRNYLTWGHRFTETLCCIIRRLFFEPKLSIFLE